MVVFVLKKPWIIKEISFLQIHTVLDRAEYGSVSHWRLYAAACLLAYLHFVQSSMNTNQKGKQKPPVAPNTIYFTLQSVYHFPQNF